MKWKTIPDYPDYKVSNFGQVMSYSRYTEGKLMNGCIDPQATVSLVYVTITNKKSSLLADWFYLLLLVLVNMVKFVGILMVIRSTID